MSGFVRENATSLLARRQDLAHLAPGGPQLVLASTRSGTASNRVKDRCTRAAVGEQIGSALSGREDRHDEHRIGDEQRDAGRSGDSTGRTSNQHHGERGDHEQPRKVQR